MGTVSGGFLTGLVVGVLLGFVAGPAVRFWLGWHQWVEVSRRARPTLDAERRMARGARGFLRERREAARSAASDPAPRTP